MHLITKSTGITCVWHIIIRCIIDSNQSPLKNILLFLLYCQQKHRAISVKKGP